MSERKPNPLLASHDPTTDMCPYSSVNPEFFDSQTPRHRASSSDRYSKLDSPYEKQEQQRGRSHSHSLTNPSSISFETSGTSPANHKERIAQIKQDLEQFSADHPAEVAANMRHSETHPPGSVKDMGHSETHLPASGGNNDKSIPKVSTRWSQFMCEEDSDPEEEESSLLTSGPLQDSPNQSVHILASKSTISKFTLVQNL